LPLSGLCFGNTVVAEARPDEQRPGARAVVIFRAVASDFIETMGMRVLRGRGLTRNDVDMRRPHVVVNQAFADTYYPQVDPIGRRIASSRPPSLGSPTWLTIVGVVSNTPSNSLAEPAPQMQLMMPMTIAGGPDIPASLLVGPNVAVMNYVVRTAVPPHDIAPLVRHALHGIDAALAIAEVKTLQETLDQSAAQMAFTMILLAVAATVALLLGVVGIYGVMSYIVSQRTAEIGVRLALGAEPQGVTRAILRQGSLMIAAGMGVGLAAAIAGGRLIEALLYDVSPRDPVVVAASTIPLLLVALVACWLPARRAAQLSPVDALRSD
jgi:putative ABC transport system permease protein